MRELASILGSVSFIHGLSLGILLIYFSSKKKPSIILGVFLVFFGLSFLFNALNDYGLVEKHHSLYLFPLRFCFLVFPLLFLYVKGLMVKLKPRDYYVHLSPGAIELVFLSFLFFYIPDDQKKAFFYEHGFLFTAAANVFTAFYLIKIIRLIKRNIEKVNEFHSAIDDKILAWLKPIVYTFLVIIFSDYIFIGAQYFALDMKHLYPILLVIYVIQNAIYTLFTYLLAFFGMKQHHIYTSSTEELSVPEPMEASKVVVKQVIDNTEYDVIFGNLNEHILQSKCYKNDELTIVDLANTMDLHYRKLSQVINHKADCTFNNFINQFRVDEAKRIMSDPERLGKLTLEVVGQEAGFKSNSSLYTAFRRFEGKTPSNFMKASD